MASMFQSLLDRTAKLHDLCSRSPGTSSDSSTYSQFVSDLEKLRMRMERIQARLEDAEEREIRERSIRLWLVELRDVAYDCEDVLDEVEYELQWYQEEEHTPSSPEKRGIKRKREVSDSDATPRCPPLHDASFQLQITAKIKDINDRFEEIGRDGLALKLHEDHGQRHSTDSLSETQLRMPTSSLVDEQAVRGRDNDKRKVMDMLLSDDGRHCKGNVGVVSIVGMGGLGKTTLAQVVYNDVQVKNHFPTRMWVCVSDSFDVVRLTKEILQTLTGRSSDLVQGSSNFNYLQESLRQNLQGVRFFLVLDDVWNENQGYWDALWLCLSSGAEGSRVLITTRNKKVSRTSFVSEANMHRLGCLSDQDAWSLFEQRAFSGRNSNHYPELVLIGKEIVKRCKGLPLTVKTLAGLSFCEFSEDRWKDILKSDLWDLAEGKDQILPALELSYRHLPSPIKLCFVYCAVFPKDHWFDRDQLVKMWMAHGYTRPTATRCMEDVGRGYFDNLLQRSFFQKGHGDYFVMHDLIHDLALSLGKGECCEVVDGKLSSIGRARHLFLNRWEDVTTCLTCEGPTGELLRLRTCYLQFTDVQLVGYTFTTMKCLRVLHLEDVNIGEVPDSLGNLRHLRYLAIDIEDCRHLPESLGNIINLQTLQLFNARDMLELPKSIKYLVNLRHLEISECSELQMMPRGIGRLTQLRTLPFFVVGEGSGAAGIQELTGLNDLQGSLEIVVSSFENNDSSKVTEVLGGDQNNGSEASNYILKNKQGLESLTLNFDFELHYEFELCDRQEKLIESLQPHTNIKALKIDEYRGRRIPKWMGDASYSRLEAIEVVCYGEKTGYCSCFWQLGQLPSLKRLRLRGVLVERHEMAVVEDSFFPSLEELSLRSFEALEGLSLGTSRCSFPRLRVLEISTCGSSKYIKLWNLAALREVTIEYCSFPKRAELQHLTALRRLTIKHCSSLKRAELQHLTALRRLTVEDCFMLERAELQHLTALRQLTVNRCGKLKLANARHLTALRRLTIEHRPENAYLQHLMARWGLTTKHCSILERAELQHLTALRQLTLKGVYHLTQPLLTQAYQDLRIISHRVGDPLGHLCHLVKVTLSGCLNCRCLPPPLGHLPNLKELHISKMPEVTHVGSEFHGGGGGIPFRSLQTLELRDMPRWEEWQDGEEEDGAFPNLQLLRICNCPILRPPKLSPRLLLMLESDFSYSDFAEESSNAADYRDPKRKRIQ